MPNQENWKQTTLGDVAVVDWGNTNLTKKSYAEKGEFLACSAKGCDGRIDHAEHDVGTTVISAIGANCGWVFYPREKFTAIKNTITVSPKAKKADPTYLYYSLIDNRIPRRGAAQPFLSKGDTENYEILLPQLAEQKAIAAVLSSFDDKIELLREENETLEGIAQAIFKRWFVDFEFPDKNGKPYKSSGGKMVLSELGEIPKGWRVGRLSEIADVDWGNTSLTKKSYTEKGQYLGVSASGGDGRMGHKEHDFGAVVISAIGAYCGRLFLPDEDFTAIKNTLVVKQLDMAHSFFVYLGLQGQWQLRRRGAAQPFISKGDTESMEITIPSEVILNNFDEIITSFFIRKQLNSLQIQTLSNLRDTLLPKLMQGDIKVKD